jgi:iron complex outermembrane recepter protein
MQKPDTFHFRNILARAVAAVVAGGIACSASAAVLEEVVVTAQKREQTLMEIPVSVSAFSGDFITKANVGDIRGLVDLTPGFNGKTEDSFIDALAIRGIVTNDFGIGGDPSIPIFTDGVWQGRNGGVQMAFYDIERVEVVKGPQATLFGRNAIAGAVSIITKKPSEEFEGRVSVGIAEYDHIEAHGMVNVPLSEQWFFRANVQGLKNDGYLENLAGGDDLGYHEQASTRLALRYAGDSVDATFAFTYEDRGQDPSVYWDPELGLPKDKVNIDLGDNGYDRSEIMGFTANVNWEIADDISLSSITGFKTYEFDYLEDYDARPIRVNNYRQKNDIDYYSQEFRLNFSGDSVNWFVGAAAYAEVIDGFFQFGYNENELCNAIGRTDSPDFNGVVTGGCTDPVFEDYWGAPIDRDAILGRKTEDSWNDMESRGYAVYADVTWSITEQLDLVLGARYTWDEKDMRTRVAPSGGALGNNFSWEFHTRGYVQADDNWSKFTPRAALNYELNDEISLYANVSTGYKAGGYGTFGITVPDADGDGEIDVANSGQASAASVPTGFEPEESLSYEVGVKTRLFDDTLQANVGLFTFTYEDLQLIYFNNGSQLVENLGEAENTGVEVDVRWLFAEHFELFAAGAWMDSEITDAQDMIDRGVCTRCEGRNMPFAPDWSAAVHLTWSYPVFGGEVFAKTEYAMQDTTYSDLDNIPNIAVDKWDEWNFRIGYDDGSDKWGVMAYVENAFDEEYFERGWANADTRNRYGYGITNTLVWPSKPRTFGASAYMNF